jgi:hypothetical protein
MTFIYHAPATVVNPKRFIREITILYDGGMDGFSLALIDWDGVKHIGIRWNVAFKEQEDADKKSGNIVCNGAPFTSGVPSWFILPRELFNPELFDRDSERFMKLIAGWTKE